ncbi:MAG: tRNA pseudouridine(38-40) synthase TruA [Bacteroidales bacterium]
MGRYKLTLEYDGTRYSGWQIQKGGKSVQGEITDSCRELFGSSDFELFGAGRTDSGVHALGQIAHLDVKTDLPLLKLKYGINDRLPPDITILNVEEAPDNFHARHDAVARSYVYQISQRRTAFGKKYVWWIKDILDTEKMAEAASLFTGLNDFSSFTDPEQEQKSTKTKIIRADIHKKGDLIIFHVIGSHFLWKQVRRMTGVLVEVGRGNMKPDQIRVLLGRYSEQPAKFTAPPSGLFLERVYYKGDVFDEGYSSLFNI